MEVIYTFQVINEWGDRLFTMVVEIDGDRGDAEEVAKEKAKEAVTQCYSEDDADEIEMWLDKVHVK